MMVSHFPQSYPIAWVIMDRRTEVAYDAVFTKVFEDFEDYAGIVMSDFETGLRNALRKSLPSAKIIGCLFHFCQVFK